MAFLNSSIKENDPIERIRLEYLDIERIKLDKISDC